MDSSVDEAYARRICSSLEKSDSIISPIHGYEKLPLVSLRKAVEPLECFVPEIQNMVYHVVANAKNPLNFLSTQEAASIRLYTLPWVAEERSFYYILNATLRSGNQERLRPWLLYLKLCITALSRLPNHSQTIFRGVKAYLAPEYPKGKTFFWWSFASCTTSIDVLKHESFLGEKGSRTIFAIEPRTGKSIRNHSEVKKENEILLPPGCQFEVVATLNMADDLHMIQLREIDSSYFSMVSSTTDGSTTNKKTSFAAPSAIPYKIPSYRNPNLQQIIEKCRPAGKLDLTLQRLNDQDMLMISDEAVFTKKCKELVLKSTGITPQRLLILLNAKHSNQYLEVLDLSENAIKDSGVKHLTSFINNSVLKTLDLSSCEILDQGAIYLAEALKTNTTLLKLILNDNEIGNNGVNMLSDVLNINNGFLKVLELRGNADIDDECIHKLIQMMKNNQCLKELDLSDCNFSEDGDQELHVAAKLEKRLKIKLSSII